MYRHELRLVLRFGVREQFNDLVQRLHQAEAARGWATPRLWRATGGQVNQIVIDHDYQALTRSGTNEQRSNSTLARSAKS
jgi:hypothetical protein